MRVSEMGNSGIDPQILSAVCENANLQFSLIVGFRV